MKPKTALQKQVAKLSATLRPISSAQTEWAYKHCIEHIAYRTKNGTTTCPTAVTYGIPKEHLLTHFAVAVAQTAVLNSKCRKHASAPKTKQTISA